MWNLLCVTGEKERGLSETGWVARLGHAVGANLSDTIECISVFRVHLAITDRSMTTNKTISHSGRARP